MGVDPSVSLGLSMGVDPLPWFAVEFVHGCRSVWLDLSTGVDPSVWLSLSTGVDLSE